MSQVSVRQALRAATGHLTAAGIQTPRVDAELLAAHAFGVERSRLVTLELPESETLVEFWKLVERRGQRIPLQHLTGSTGFRYLDLEVRPGVFVPRPETEMVVEVAIEFAHGGTRVRMVDLCTGAGGIALAFAQEVPASAVWAVDISPEAIDLTRHNARNHSLDVTAIVADIREKSLLVDLAGTIDIVVSNPPYIPFDAEPLDAEVRDYDPQTALYGGGEDGLAIPAAVVARAFALLREGGLVVVEHGDSQGAQMRELLDAHGGFRDVHTRTDLTGRERMVVARRAEVAH